MEEKKQIQIRDEILDSDGDSANIAAHVGVDSSEDLGDYNDRMSRMGA